MYYLDQYRRQALGEDGRSKSEIPIIINCPPICGQCGQIHRGKCDPELKAAREEFQKRIKRIFSKEETE